MPVFSPFIRYFDEVARQGSIRKAAERLHVAPSAVSRQILKLEDELGTPLFERLPRGLRLTAAGEILIECARRWQRDFGEVRAQFDELKGLQRGHVELAVVEGAIAAFVPDVLAHFNEAHPRVSVSVEVAGSEAVMRQVIAADAEIGILFNLPLRPELRIVRAARFRLGAIVSPGHPLTALRQPRLRDCAPYPAIVSDETVSLRAVLDAALAKTRVTLTVVAESNILAVMRALVRRGVGIAFMTALDVLLESRSGELTYVPLGDAAIAASVLSVCVAADRPLSPPAALLAEHFSGALAGLE